MPSAKSEVEAQETDPKREQLATELAAELGTAIVATHLVPGRDLWLRISADVWASTIESLRDRGFTFFDWLSAIDWKQSTFGRSLDSAVDATVQAEQPDVDDDVFTGTGADGYSGGNTRFQVMVRLTDLKAAASINLKVDVADDELRLRTIVEIFPGAEWHEREVYEMFGIAFDGHPKLKKLYLPGDFAGHPMRKDFPLVARMVKPWPGIVDVEPMPEAKPESTPLGASTVNPQDGGVQ